MTNQTIMQYTKREELLNVITHAPGILMGLLFTIALVIKYSVSGNLAQLISFLVYGTSFIALFMASSLYHKSTNLKRKAILKKIDHSCIYIFMAGCYTPFIINNMVVSWKYWFLLLVWSIATTGVIFKCISKFKNIYFSVFLYLAFAYMCFLAKKDLLDVLPSQAFELLALGGFFYTLGAVFYVAKKMRYHHAIWHVFVLVGAGLHFLAIYKSA
jgi:hemolysin III